MSFRRSDEMMTSASVGEDEESVFEFRESCPDELGYSSRYGSGMTDWNPSTDDLPIRETMFEPSDDLKLSSGGSEIAITLQYHSGSSGYGRHCQLSSEAAEAVAGIPRTSSNSYSSFGTTCLSSSVQSSIRTQLDQDTPDKSGGVSCHGSAPHQVEDDGEQLNWNPVEDVMHRIKMKIKFLLKSKCVAESDISLLLIAEGIY